jgi:glycosyltransferase involved in cell wall biosynthesis
VRHLFKHLQRKISFDVIHQLNPVTTGVNLFLPAKSIPFVVGPLPPSWAKESASRLGLLAAYHSIFRYMIRWEMFRRASCILIPVPGGRDIVPNIHILRSRIKLLHYGIDTKQFAPKNNFPSATKFDLHVLFLANMYKVKGIYDLLQAFEITIKSVPQARLTIAGDGPERESVKRMVDAMPDSNRITMLGSISRDKLANLFHSCSVYCLPSHGEPFGMTALEAMSCGKPVVATAAGGLDYLVDEQGGVKVPVGDVEKLAEALTRLLKDPQLCRQMGNHNREVAVSEYDWDRVISNLEEIYEQAIQGQ